MDIEIIREKLTVAKKELEKLEQKKSLVEKKIKAKQEQIDGYSLQISQCEMKELKQSLIANGTSLAEMVQALKSGDLSNIQNKLRQNA